MTTPGAALLLLLKLQRRRIDAIAQARGLRTVLEDVAEVRVAPGAVDFRAPHEEGVVLARADVVRDGCMKTRPAGAGLELGVRVEQLQVTGDAAINTRLVVVQVLAGEGAFGAVLAGNAILLRREELLPFGVGPGDFLNRHIRGCVLGDCLRGIARDLRRPAAGQQSGHAESEQSRRSPHG